MNLTVALSVWEVAWSVVCYAMLATRVNFVPIARNVLVWRIVAAMSKQIQKAGVSKHSILLVTTWLQLYISLLFCDTQTRSHIYTHLLNQS